MKYLFAASAFQSSHSPSENSDSEDPNCSFRNFGASSFFSALLEPSSDFSDSDFAAVVIIDGLEILLELLRYLVNGELVVTVLILLFNVLHGLGAPVR